MTDFANFAVVIFGAFSVDIGDNEMHAAGATLYVIEMVQVIGSHLITIDRKTREIVFPRHLLA